MVELLRRHFVFTLIMKHSALKRICNWCFFLKVISFFAELISFFFHDGMTGLGKALITVVYASPVFLSFLLCHQ